jgi:hypothetical protein
MIYKFLSFLFFCGACVSVFGQELQSPQISQNAIFANPGLAGSKGQTRTCASAGVITKTTGEDSFQSPLQTNTQSNLTISADGTILKKSIGIGGYINNTSYSVLSEGNFTHSLSNPDLLNEKKFSKYNSIGLGLIVAPKFYLNSNNASSKSHCFSPSISFGMRESSYQISSDSNLKNYQGQLYDVSYSEKNSYVSFDHISAGLLYNTTTGYYGLKINYLQSALNRYDVSFALVGAHSFYNKKITNPNFSFNPQIYLALYLKTSEKNATQIQAPYFVNQGVTCNVNLDFKYRKIIFGGFLYGTKYMETSMGITGGIQFKATRIVLNYISGLYFNKTGSVYLSVNFFIKKYV